MKKILFVFLTLVLVSCGSSKDTRPETVTLNGEYQLIRIDGQDLSAQDLSITFTPGEHRISGETGCNGFSAKYTQENNVLSIGRAMSTRMFCEGKMDTEQQIMSSLEDVAKVQKNGDHYVFYSTDDEALFTLIKKQEGEQY